MINTFTGPPITGVLTKKGLTAVPMGPTDSRSLFELFRLYRPDVGLERLLMDAGVARGSPRQIYHAVHNRPPDSLDSSLPVSEYNPVAGFIGALSSLEFQENLASHILRAFPEKRRLFFVHIPKTAGVDLATHMICRYPSLNTNLLNRILTPKREQIFLAIKHIVLELPLSDTIFISGHTPLGVYQKWAGNGIRYQDHVFTVIREPLEQIVSQINYTLTRIFSDETPIAPDTAGWRREFGVPDDSPRPSGDAIMQLARRVLRHKGVVVPNVICTFLAGSSYEEAIVRTVAHDLEVVELKQLDQWTEQNWNVTERTRLNSSEKYLSVNDLSSDDLAYAREISQDDFKYYETIMAAYERHGGTSVRGSRVVK